jgi:hypothetical protein
MEWDQSDIAALSRFGCADCDGKGTRVSETGKESTCNCVYRNIFRKCYQRFQECAGKDEQACRLSTEKGITRGHSSGWGRKEEEYVADFCLIAKRILSEEEHRVFRFHFLLGADYRLCCRQMKIDRGAFFHFIYRIQRKLGKAFKEMEPYPLYPLSDYFSGPARVHSAKVVTIPEPKKPLRIHLSQLKRAA